MKSFEAQGPGPVPKLLLWVCIVILAVTTVELFVGGWRLGVTWDEPYHVERYRNYLDHGWYVIDAQSQNGKPFDWVTDQYVYGPATMTLLHLWNMLFGVDSPGVVSTTAHGYQFRHLAVSLIGIIGLLGVATLGRQVLRRWDWGVVAAAALCAVPLWVGHAMFNMKDVPVATGYVWVTVGLALIARREAGGWCRRLAALAAIAGGAFLCVGTRPGMWAGMLSSTVALLVLVAYRDRGGDGSLLKRHGWRLAEVFGGFGVAYLSLLALYPKVFAHPVTVAHESVSSSVNFLGIVTTRAFLPGHLAMQMPFVFQILTWIGVAAALLALIRHLRRPEVVHVRLSLIGVQLLTLPSITLVHGSGLYGDLRHLLFSAPAAAIFVVVGIATVVERARRGVDKVKVVVPVAIGAVALAFPVIDQATLFPYNYSYYNAASIPADLRGNLDYYRASPRALLPDLPPDGRVVCSPIRLPDERVSRVGHLDGSRDCRTAITSPIAAFASEARGKQPALKPDEFWAIMSMNQVIMPSNCELVDRVTRWHLVEKVGMSVLARCRLDGPTLGDAPVAPDKQLTESWELLDEGWYLPAFSPHQDGFRAAPEGGSIRFGLTSSSSSRELVVRTVEPFDPASVEAEFDGATVPVRARGSKELVVTLPAGAAAQHVLAFRPSGSGEFYFVIQSVQAE